VRQRIDGRRPPCQRDPRRRGAGDARHPPAVVRLVIEFSRRGAARARARLPRRHPRRGRAAAARALNARPRPGARLRSPIVERYAVSAERHPREDHADDGDAEHLGVAVIARSGSLALGYFPHSPTTAARAARASRTCAPRSCAAHETRVAGAFIAPINGKPRIMIRTGGTTKTGARRSRACTRCRSRRCSAPIGARRGRGSRRRRCSTRTSARDRSRAREGRVSRADAIAADIGRGRRAAGDAGRAAPGAIKARMAAIAAAFWLLETKSPNVQRAPTVVDGWLPPKPGADAEQFPFMLVRPRTGTTPSRAPIRTRRPWSTS
jgi:hypothetical protein